MDWKVKSLEKLFNPRTIAVIGASDKPNRLGALTLLSLKESGAKILPVNPRLDSIGEMECFPSVNEIEEHIDLAMIALQGPRVHSAIVECASVGVKSAIIFSAGFKELGPLGEQMQNQIKTVADDARMAIIGPNCLGAGNIRRSLNATFFPHPIQLTPGNVALISQSGGVAGLMIYAAADAEVGLSKFASVGNRVNIDFPDLLRYFRQDKETDVICVFVEGTEKGREMYDEMVLTTKVKQVLMYKVGKTPVSRSAALSHTGSLAGQPDLYSAAAKQASVIEVDGVSELINCAKVLSQWKWKPKGRSVAIVTHTLGPALIAAQILEENGAHLPPPSPQTQKTIQDILDMPVAIPISNPVDLLAQGWSNPDLFAEAFKLVLNESQYDVVMTMFSPNYQESIGGGMPINEMIQSTRNAKKPVVAILNSPGRKPPPGWAMLETAGIPVFASPESAAIAIAKVISKL
jgi:acetyltransferase